MDSQLKWPAATWFDAMTDGSQSGPAAPTDEAIEIVTFRLMEGATFAHFADANREVDAWLLRQPGFRSRRIGQPHGSCIVDLLFRAAASLVLAQWWGRRFACVAPDRRRRAVLPPHRGARNDTKPDWVVDEVIRFQAPPKGSGRPRSDSDDPSRQKFRQDETNPAKKTMSKTKGIVDLDSFSFPPTGCSFADANTHPMMNITPDIWSANRSESNAWV